jgi:hypothetical protein
MKLKLFVIIWIFLSSGNFSLIAGENEDFESLLQQVQPLEGKEKAEIFAKYAQTHAGKDSAIIVLVLQQAALMEEPIGLNTELVENALNNIISLKPDSWQSIFAKIGILGLLNIDGQDQRLIQYGEMMLAKENFDLFDKGTDSLLLSLKKSFPNTLTMRMGVIEYLIVSYEHLEFFEQLDNKTRIAELQQQLAMLRANSNQQTSAITNQDDVISPSSLNSQPTVKSTLQPPLNMEKQDSVLLMILIGMLLLLLVGIMVFIVIRNHGK